MSKQGDKKLNSIIQKLRRLYGWLDYPHPDTIRGRIEFLIEIKEHEANQIILKTAFKNQAR